VTEFKQAELGEPFADFTLHPGDVMYFPRGVVHQALAQDGSCAHSLHLTFSTYQRHTWRDLLLRCALSAGARGRLEAMAKRAGSWLLAGARCVCAACTTLRALRCAACTTLHARRALGALCAGVGAGDSD
jgi:hypothetical protein